MYKNEDFCLFVKKELLVQRKTLRQLVEELNEKFNWNITANNFSSKLHRGTLRYNEMMEILDVLGKTIVVLEKDKIVKDVIYY